MARTLRDDVYVDGRRYRRGQSAADVGDVAVRIGDHAWVGEDDESSYDRGGDLSPSASVVNAGASETVVGAGSDAAEGSDSVPAAGDGPAGELEPPAKAGPGSSAEAWRDYARSVGVDVPGDAKRDDVIDLVRAAGKSVG